MYADRLLELYDAQQNFIQPTARRNGGMALVKRGLRDLSISRSVKKLDWGIPVPGDDSHVMYVWVDALTNYITGVGYPDTENADFKKYWPADIHVIGKDIVRFHAMIWPALLMAADLPLPKQIYAHGFLNNRGEKMSKSVGNVIDPIGLANTYGVDALRYFFCREVPYGQDGSYSHETVTNRVNADLANDLGNLAQRSLSMLNKNLGGVLPEPTDLQPQDKAILDQADAMLDLVRAHMEDRAIHKALGVIWDVVAEANRYFAGEEPWALKKTDPVRMGTNAATANGAIAGFVKSAAIEMPRALRINVVSPGMLDVSAPRYGKWFHGHKPVPSHDVGLAYAKCVEGALTGQVMIVE